MTYNDGLIYVCKSNKLDIVKKVAVLESKFIMTTFAEYLKQILLTKKNRSIEQNNAKVVSIRVWNTVFVLWWEIQIKWLTVIRKIKDIDTERGIKKYHTAKYYKTEENDKYKAVKQYKKILKFFKAERE